MGLKFWYGLLIRDFISLASSNNDSHMLMKQKCKQRFAHNFFVFLGLKKIINTRTTKNFFAPSYVNTKAKSMTLIADVPLRVE